MQVGDLTVRMAADLADLRTGFEKARGDFASFASDASASIDKVRNSLIALATGYSLVETIRQTIEYGTALQRLQDITGLAAAEVQQLSLIAKLNDADAQSLTKSWGKLVQQLVDVGSAGDATRAVIKALGVDAFDPLSGKVRPANELMAQLAAAFNAIQDPAIRAKLASELFGKSYQDQLVIFANWTEDSAKVKELFEKIAPATDDATKKADAFGDSFTLLAETTKAKLLPSLSDLGGLLENVRTFLLDAGTASGDFGAGVNTLTKDVLPAAVDTIGSLAIAAFSLVNALVTLGKGLNDAPGADTYAGKWERVKQAMADADKVIDDSNGLLDLLHQRMAAGTQVVNEDANARARNTAVVVDNGNAALAAAQKLKDEEAARKAAASAAAKQAEELAKLRDKYDEILAADAAGLATNTIKQIEELGQLLAARVIDWQKYNDLLGIVLDKDPVLAQEQKDLNKSLEEMAKLIDQVREARAKELSSIDDQIAQQRLANATFGLGKTAVVDYTIAELARQQAQAAGIPGEEDAIDQLQRRIDKMLLLRDAVSMGEALEAQKKALDESAKAWDGFINSVGQAFGNFLNDWVDNGASTAFRNLWENFKKWALQALAEVAAKQVVVSIVGAVGSSGAGAGGLLGGGSGDLGVLGDLGKGFGSLLSGSLSLGTAFENLGTILPTFTTMLDAGATVGEALSGAFAGMGASLGAVVPVIGGVIAAGTLIYNWLDSKKGGPKDGGWATTGPTPGITGTDNSGRWFTPNTQDAALQTAVNAINTQYQTILAALGGTGSATFAQGYSTDPKGTAPSNVHTGVFVNGSQVVDIPNGSVGRDAESLKAELERQSMQAILAALQASDLPTIVSDYLKSIDVSTATVDQIQAALAHAADLKVLVDQVSALPKDMADGLLAALGASPELDAQIADFAAQFSKFSAATEKLNEQLARDPADEVNKLALAQATSFEKVGLLRQGLVDAIAAYDGTAAGTDKLTAATKDYIDAQVAALAQIEDIKKSLDTMFGDTQRTFDLALLDSKAKEQFFADEAAKTIDLLKNTTDPEKIAELSKIINSDLTSALGLIDPVAQRAEYDRLQGILTTAQSQATTQLGLAHDAVLEANANAHTVLDAVRAASEAAAAKQAEAADRLIVAADAILAAAKQNATAADKNSTAADQQSQAAATQAAAATAALTAANTPVTVQVITYNGGEGP